ncbi:hypothetical protein ACLQ7P_08545 [Bacillus subtilis subsp. subtilis]
MKPKFAIGDIVEVEGYKDRIFYVDCWREVTQHEEYGAFDYVEYDLTDAINGEWLEANSDDLRLVCRKAASEDFLWNYDMTKKKAKEDAEKIDGLRDEYNDYMRLYEAFGDAEYKTKADGVLAKLRREAGE